MTENDKYHSALALSRESPPDLTGAHALLTEASKDGDDRASYALATWYLFGNELIEKDESIGISILLKLKESLIAEALFDLAVCYDKGHGVEQNEIIAFSLYMQAALLGDKESCIQISQFYTEGQLVQYSEELASSWKKRSECDEKDISPPYRTWLDY